jgi:hypothetical protein
VLSTALEVVCKSIGPARRRTLFTRVHGKTFRAHDENLWIEILPSECAVTLCATHER